MFRKGIALVVMLLFVGTIINPISGIGVFNDDTTPPVSNHTIVPATPDGDNGWYVSDIEVTLWATDDMSGVDFIKYLLDDNNWMTYTNPLVIESDGFHRITYYAVDKAGNVEQPSEVLRFKTDQTIPDIYEVEWDAYKEPPLFGEWYVTFTCYATDATSGMDRVEMFINDWRYETIKGPGPIYEFVFEWSIAFSNAAFWFYHYDVAGNVIWDEIVGDEVTCYNKNSKSNQQSSSTPSSQSEMSVISSTGKIDVATSRTTFNDGTLSGYVNDTSMNPIEGALVCVYFHETYEENYTDSSGYYHVTNIPICYCMKNCTASKLGYRTEGVLLSIDENTTHDFILMDNQPPSAPDIEGPTVKPVSRPLPKQGEPINYTFKSTDPDGDNVSYYIEWGDGTYEDWFGPFESGEEVTRNHTWSEEGDFTIKAKAKDIHGAESEWGTLKVTMPKNQQVSNMWFLRWLERFPILQMILDVLRLNIR